MKELLTQPRITKGYKGPVFPIKGKRNTKGRREYVSTSKITNRLYGIYLKPDKIYQYYQCDATDRYLKNKVLIGKPFKGKYFEKHLPVAEAGVIHGIIKVKAKNGIKVPIPYDYA